MFNGLSQADPNVVLMAAGGSPAFDVASAGLDAVDAELLERARRRIALPPTEHQ